MRFNMPFMCTKFQLDRRMHSQVWLKMRNVEKDEEKKTKKLFGTIDPD